MFSKINFGARVVAAILLLLIPLAATIYGATPTHCWVSLFGESGGFLNGFAKNCAATGSCAAILLLLGLLNPQFLKTGSMMILGLVFSMIGNWFMKQGNLIGGIGFFGLAHLCFMTFFLLNGKFNKFGVAALVIFAAAYTPYLIFCIKPGLEAAAEQRGHGSSLLFAAVVFYLTVSIFSVVSTFMFNTKCWIRLLAILGISCILFSDTVIAERIFCGRDKLWILMMPTYLATHFLITAAAVFDFLLVKNEPKKPAEA